jgi:hypothetical protein
MPENSAETILGRLKDAGAHAFQTEAPNYPEAGVVKQRDDFASIDILVNEGTVSVPDMGRAGALRG